MSGAIFFHYEFQETLMQRPDLDLAHSLEWVRDWPPLNPSSR